MIIAMSKSHLRHSLVLGMLLVLGTSNAQTTASTAPQHPLDTPLTLTLDQSIEVALNENPTIKIAGLEITRQEYVRKETVGNLLPNLSASAAYNRAIKKSTINAGSQKFSFEPSNTVMAQGNLSLPLIVPAVYRTLKLNDEQMRAAVESARATKIGLIAQVKQSFYNILLAQESLDVLRASESNISQVVDQTQALFNQGLASEYDLLTAQVQLSNLQPTIIQTEKSIDLAKQLFKMYLYLPQEIQITLSGTLIDFKGHEPLSEQDLSNNSDLRQMEIQENIMAQQLSIARTARMPSLAAVGSVQMMGRDKISLGGLSGPTTPGTGTPKSEWELQTPIAVGLQLSVPIFAGNSRIQKERQIKNSMAQLSLQRNYLQQSVDVEAQSALTSIVTARAQMAATERTINQASKGYDISKTRYFNGVGTILELNSAELSLTQARLNFSQALFDYLVAEAQYRQILGREE